MPKLTSTELDAVLQEHPDWKLLDGTLVRQWVFPGFPQAIAFVNQVAELAEQLNHHPDMDIRYNKVRLALASHDAGGITSRDIKFLKTLKEIEDRPST